MSEPINRKLTVSLFVSGGRAVGSTPGSLAGGGATEVGKSEFKSTVGVASTGGTGVEEAVAVGRESEISNGVGVFSDG